MAKALAHLCALKRTTDFTDLQVDAWYGGLKSFPAWIINRAVITLATSTERFPEFGDVYQLCRRESIRNGLIVENYSPHGGGDTEISKEEITTIGNALGLVVNK